MAQELIYKNVAIIGAGASGGLAAILLSKNPTVKVTLFDEKEPFTTLLPTGGGRCNLSYNEPDIKEFVKNYPRGEKFLLSVFSKYDVTKTRKLFNDLGIKTYVQEDNRIFPVSNSAEVMSNKLKGNLTNIIHKKEKVIEIKKNNEFFTVKTSKTDYEFEYVILATGGKENGFELVKNIGHKIIDPKPSLTSLDIKENYLYKLSGISFKNIEIATKLNNKKFPICIGDILFTHKSISGPAIFKVSALTAFENFDKDNPLEMTIKLLNINYDDIENEIKNNQKKSIKNVFSKFVPDSYIEAILNENNFDGGKQVAQIKKNEKEILINSLLKLNLHATNRIKGSEIVTAGGVDLNEVNAKTMESKIIKNLFFTGEILNIDGYTGGFNLQNCWSTACIACENFN